MATAHTSHEEPNYMNIFWALTVLTVLPARAATVTKRC